jgi:sialate O-acetylesterase
MILLLAGTVGAPAEVKLAGMFTDNMILQRDSNAPVWGTADPGETVGRGFRRE